jgi:hypothetical protein
LLLLFFFRGDHHILIEPTKRTPILGTLRLFIR